jgi:hypothetical protein
MTTGVCDLGMIATSTLGSQGAVAALSLPDDSC